MREKCGIFLIIFILVGVPLALFINYLIGDPAFVPFIILALLVIIIILFVIAEWTKPKHSVAVSMQPKNSTTTLRKN